MNTVPRCSTPVGHDDVGDRDRRKKNPEDFGGDEEQEGLPIIALVSASEACRADKVRPSSRARSAQRGAW